MNRIYSNRAACHLMLNQYRECIQDCTCVSLLPTLPYFHPFVQSMVTALEVENNFTESLDFQATFVLKLCPAADVLSCKNFQAQVLRKNADLIPSHFLLTKPCTTTEMLAQNSHQSLKSLLFRTHAKDSFPWKTPMFPFYTKVFLVFLGGIKWEPWPEMG